MINKKSAVKALAFLSIVFGSVQLQAADIDMNANQNDIAISGYDPVSYFTEGEAQSGSAIYTATHKNAIYHFASAENRDKFKADPTAYAPQFGGYCAMGVALYKKLDVDPHAWKIVDNKLYLNLNKKVQKSWLSDTKGHIAEANGNWKDIKSTPAQELNES